LLYAYIFYPLLLPVLARFFGRAPLRGNGCPTVTIVVPAYNEADVILKKINNILALDYPADKLTVLVGSDASTDATHTLVQSVRDARVKLWVAPQRGGKTPVVNQCAAQALSEIILFTDANTMHDRASLRLLVRSFNDPAVGGAAGRIDHSGVLAAAQERHAEIAYRNFEVRLKQNESLLHSCIAAFGGFMRSGANCSGRSRLTPTATTTCLFP